MTALMQQHTVYASNVAPTTWLVQLDREQVAGEGSVLIRGSPERWAQLTVSTQRSRDARKQSSTCEVNATIVQRRRQVLMYAQKGKSQGRHGRVAKTTHLTWSPPSRMLACVAVGRSWVHARKPKVTHAVSLLRAGAAAAAVSDQDACKIARLAVEPATSTARPCCFRRPFLRPFTRVCVSGSPWSS